VGSSAISLADAIDNLLENLAASYCPQNGSIPAQHCGLRSPTRVISISYGEHEILVPKAVQERQCNDFMKLALQGHTFTMASGDSGVASQPQGYSGNNISSNGCIVAGNYNATFGHGNGPTRNGTVFSPTYPQNCPYILSVGGTQLRANATVENPESALQAGRTIRDLQSDYPLFQFSSGGGLSNYFQRPAYQTCAVDEYFLRNDPGYAYYTFNGLDFSQDSSNIGTSGGLYNRAGRAFPDVSANGGNLGAYLSGNLSRALETSFSAPIWASILTLINEKRSQAGKGPVGFVNPVLYVGPQYHDRSVPEDTANVYPLGANRLIRK